MKDRTGTRSKKSESSFPFQGPLEWNADSDFPGVLFGGSFIRIRAKKLSEKIRVVTGDDSDFLDAFFDTNPNKGWDQNEPKKSESSEKSESRHGATQIFWTCFPS